MRALPLKKLRACLAVNFEEVVKSRARFSASEDELGSERVGVSSEDLCLIMKKERDVNNKAVREGEEGSLGFKAILKRLSCSIVEEG